MTTIISHLKLLVPVIEKPPPELMDAFIKGCIRAAPLPDGKAGKTYQHLSRMMQPKQRLLRDPASAGKKALPDTKAVIRKCGACPLRTKMGTKQEKAIWEKR